MEESETKSDFPPSPIWTLAEELADWAAQRHRAEERAYIAGLVRKHAGFRQQSTPLPVFDAGLVRSSRMEDG